MPSAIDALALAGTQGIKSGMTVGLGTGRAALRAINALAQRVEAEKLEVRCAATSERSAERARELGLTVVSMNDLEKIDWLFDGADEVDPSMHMLKGRGAAMTREKVVARAAAYRVYLVQESKLVERLGTNHRLPVEVLDFAAHMIHESLEKRGLPGEVRLSPEGVPIRTDDGNPILDVTLPVDIDLWSLGLSLDSTPGVIGHGLFLTEADEIIVEDESGAVRSMHRRH